MLPGSNNALRLFKLQDVKQTSRLSALPKRELGCLGESPVAKGSGFPSVTTRLFSFSVLFFKALAEVPALLKKSTAPPGAFGPAPAGHPLCPCPPARTCPPACSLRDARALRAFPPAGSLSPVRFFGVTPVIPGAAVDGARWPRRGSQPCCRASRLLPRPKALPCPRLAFYPKLSQMAKVPRAKRAADCRLH